MYFAARYGPVSSRSVKIQYYLWVTFARALTTVTRLSIVTFVRISRCGLVSARVADKV